MISVLLLIIIYFSFVSMGIQDSLLGAAWPSMYEPLNVPLHYAGIISMIISIGRIISSIFSEKLNRRFGTGIVAAAGILLFASALFGISFSENFLQLCFWAIPLSLGAGLSDVTLNNYVALNYKARHMIWVHCFWGIGASIGPIIMSFYLINNNSWNLGYRVNSIFPLVITAVLFIIIPLWEKNKPLAKIEEKKTNAIHHKELLHVAGIKQILAIFFSNVSFHVIIVLWGSSFLVLEKNILPETAAQWLALYYIGITICRFITGFLSIKLNNRQIIRLGHGIIACGIIVLILPFGQIFLMLGFFILGLGFAPLYPCLLHETPKNFGNKISQAVMGWQIASGCVGGLIIPPLFGRIASFAGFHIFPVFIGALLIIMTLMFEALTRKVDNAGM